MRRNARVGDRIAYKDTRDLADVIEKWGSNYTLRWLDGERAFSLSYVSGEVLRESFEIYDLISAKKALSKSLKERVLDKETKLGRHLSMVEHEDIRFIHFAEEARERCEAELSKKFSKEAFASVIEFIERE